MVCPYATGTHYMRVAKHLPQSLPSSLVTISSKKHCVSRLCGFVWATPSVSLESRWLLGKERAQTELCVIEKMGMFVLTFCQAQVCRDESSGESSRSKRDQRVAQIWPTKVTGSVLERRLMLHHCHRTMWMNHSESDTTRFLLLSDSATLLENRFLPMESHLFLCMMA